MTAVAPASLLERLPEEWAELFVEWARDPTKIVEMKKASQSRIREWGVEQTVLGVIDGVRKALAS